LRQYSHKLQDSERRTVLLGIATLALALVYLLLSQSLDQRKFLQQRKADLLAQEQWLHEQAVLLSQLGNRCAGSQTLELGPDALLRLLAQRAALDIVNLTAAGSRYVLELSGDGNAVLMLAQQSICQGLAVERIDLSRTAAGLRADGSTAGSNGESRVQATMELRDDS
jgi:type II secretory pathway component PulM